MKLSFVIARETRSAFSLVEVAIALGIAAIAIPAILGVMGVFSRTTSEVVDQGEATSILNSVELYLGGQVLDPDSNSTLAFSELYTWVYEARQDPAMASLVYAYRPAGVAGAHVVSEAVPAAESVEGRIFAVEIHAPEPSILPDTVLLPNLTDYSKPYLPLNASLHALSVGNQARSRATLIDEYPLVIAR